MEKINELLGNNSFLFLLAGVLLTLFLERLFKFFSSYLWPRRANYHVSLYHSGDDEFFKTSSNGDFSLDVKFNGKQIDDTVAITTFKLYNDGRNDIGFSNHFDGPIMVRSSEYEIVDATSLGNELVNTEVKVDANRLVRIKWGILKKDESIKIQLIGLQKNSENPKKSTLFDSLEFKVRSDCINSINRPAFSIKDWFWIITPAFIVATFVSFLLDKDLFFKDNKEVPSYSFNINDTIIRGAIKYDSSECITICNTDDSSVLSKGLKSDNYLKITEFKEVDKSHSFLLIMALSYVGALLMGVVFFIYDHRKHRPRSFE
ncbi:MAG: hypothetical protein J6Z32_04230 [Bacteroidales bacterium]|nr:hypothetical protein [Bacteroidales bacterium]